MNMILLVSNPFTYSFMQRAMVALLLLAFILPLVGMKTVTRRMSMIGDTISHTSLCGIAIGLACSILPVYTAILVSVLSGILIEVIRERFRKYAEISLSIVLSFAIALTAILTKYTSANSFESFLFGSILTVTWEDVVVLLVVFLLDVLFFVFFHRTEMAIGYSEQESRVRGLKVRMFDILSMVLVTASIAVASYIIGSLLVTSLLVIPVACSMRLFKGYMKITICSVVISFLSSFIGLFLSYYLDINTGGTMIMTSLFFLLCSFIYSFVRKKVNLKNIDKH